MTEDDSDPDTGGAGAGTSVVPGDPAGGIAVVVVAYGSPDLLATALGRLEGRYPVIVVDNSASAETRAVVERHGARYVDPGANLGFARAVNLARASLPRGVDVLLLNPDASIAPGAVEKLRSALHDDPAAACIAPAQRAPGSTTRDRVCWPFPSPARAWIEAVGCARAASRWDFVIGSVLLIRAEALADVGGFDEDFFLYAEETDWQLRAVRRGWRVLFADDVEAEHVGAGTGGDPVRREVRFHASQERFVRKWHGNGGWQLYRAAQLTGALARAALRRGATGEADRRRARLYLRGPSTVLAGLGAETPAVPRPVAVAPATGSSTSRGTGRPLRVVHVVCTDAFAGVERYVVTVAAGLAARGCEVVVVGGHPRQMPSELGPAGVAWYPGASARAAVARLARLGRADVVHAHMSDAELAATLALPATRAKLVVTRHFAQRRGSSPAARALGALAPYVVAEQLAISQFVAESIDGASVVVVPGVRDVDDPAPPERRRSTVLMVQRLAQEKRVEVGIEAFARSDLRRQGWSLEIAGSGPADAELRALAARLDLGESCRFLGQRFDVDALYREAGIFLATRPDEPYGLSVVEAMAHGLAVVAARGGGHSETVGCADEPALFRAGDVDDAARQLSELARDAARRARYGAELRAIQRARFTTSQQVEQTLAVYRRVTA